MKHSKSVPAGRSASGVRRVAMLVTNDVSNDSRVKKEALALTRRGFHVQVFGYDQVSKASRQVQLQPFGIFLIGTKRRSGGPGQANRSRPSLSKLATRRSCGHSLFSAFRALTRLSLYQFVAPFFAPRLRRLIFSRQFQKFGAKSLVAWAPDIVHCHDLDTAPLGLYLSRKLKIPLIYDSHELWLKRNVAPGGVLQESLATSIESSVERRVIQTARAHITVSSSYAQRLEENYGLSRSTFTVIRNIPDIVEGLSSNLGARESQPTAYYSGRITANRLLFEFVEALAEGGFPHVFSLLGYGDEKYIEKLKSLGKAKKVPIRLCSPVNSRLVSKRLERADFVFVGVNPVVDSYRFSLPNKFFEGLFSGAPLVAPRLPELENAAEGLSAIYFFDSGSLLSLVDSIRDAQAFEGDRNELKRERTERYSWQGEASKLAEIYAELRRQ